MSDRNSHLFRKETKDASLNTYSDIVISNDHGMNIWTTHLYKRETGQ